jgi:hypothetical protein
MSRMNTNQKELSLHSCEFVPFVADPFSESPDPGDYVIARLCSSSR